MTIIFIFSLSPSPLFEMGLQNDLSKEQTTFTFFFFSRSDNISSHSEDKAPQLSTLVALARPVFILQ